MAGFFGKKYDPESAQRQSLYQGLLGMGAGLMAAGAPRVGSPGPSGLAMGLQGFQQGQQNYMDRYNQQYLTGRKIQSLDMQDKLNQQQYEAGIAANKSATRKIAAQNQLIARLRERGDNIKADAIEAGGIEAYNKSLFRKPEKPKHIWVKVDGKAKLVPEAEAAEMGYGKWDAPHEPLSAERQAQKIATAKAQAENRPLTDGEKDAGGYAFRMVNASKDLEAVGAGPDGVLGTKDDYVPNPVDVELYDNETMGSNYLVSAEYKQYRQAQENWVTANLREESGAVIGADEMQQEISKYFPVPGDPPKTVVQKAKARRLAEAAMKARSGKAYKRVSEHYNAQEGFEVVD